MTDVINNSIDIPQEVLDELKEKAERKLRDDAELLACKLTATARHIREVAAYYRLHGDAEQLDEAAALIRRLAAVAPAGMVLVPIEPTPEMVDEGAKGMASWQDGSVWPDSWEPTQVRSMRRDAAKAYRHMLAAALAASGDDHEG